MGPAEQLKRGRRRARFTRRRMVAAAGSAAIAGVLLGPAGPAQASHGMGIMRVANPSNGTYTAVDTNGYPSPGSGLRASRGDVLKVKAWELKPNATYALWIIWPEAVFEGTTCRYANAETGRIMENALKPGVLLSTMETNSYGHLDRNPNTPDIDAYKAVLPDDPRAAQGTAEICAREVSPAPEQTTTQHVRFTIV